MIDTNMDKRLKQRIAAMLRRVWNAPGIVGIALGVAAWAFGLSRIGALERASPAAPNLAFRETVPVHWGAGMVYMTARDAEFVHWFPLGGMAAMFVVVAVASWWEHKNKRADRD